MTTLREAAQEMLVTLDKYFMALGYIPINALKFEALRAALAEPEVIRSEEGIKDGNPVDEPVAGFPDDEELNRFAVEEEFLLFCSGEEAFDIMKTTLHKYLHPQRRLSDEEILAKAPKRILEHWEPTEIIAFARALEKEQRK